MTKKKDPLFNGSDSQTFTLPYFGSRRELSSEEFYFLHLACTTAFSYSEPKGVTRARNRIRTAERTRVHFGENALSPIFDAFDFEGLKLRKVI